MSDQDRPALSRRHWIGMASVPLVAAALEPGEASAADDLAGAAPAEKNQVGSKVFNIRDHGAKGDGQTLDTLAIQSAIDACAADRGGTVLVPAGTFLIGPIELKSNVTLRIAADGK